MTTLEPEQKDILEKLNQLALEEGWGTVERDPNGIPKGVAVIMEAMEEIKRLRMRIINWRNDIEADEKVRKETTKNVLKEYSKMLIDEFVESGNNQCNTTVAKVLRKCCPEIITKVQYRYADKYGVEIENE